MADIGANQQRPLLTGVPAAVSPLVRRIVAPNPGVMTGPGTNTYLVGVDEVAVIDPAVNDEAHIDAILGCGGDRIRWILCTHTHQDHATGVAELAAATGAPVLGFTSRDGLAVDRQLVDGDRIEGSEFDLVAVHTPGHASNHLCFLLEQERTVFSGDHVMQGSTVVINPPDGDMAAYLASLVRLQRWRPALRRIAPGHGQVIESPTVALAELVAHRLDRERQVLDAVLGGEHAVEGIVARLYPGLVEELVPRAGQSVYAHLRKLVGDGRLRATDVDDASGAWLPA
jgi:glyoxylase-like metal-dependent hydrolase (beta-lactamase superfamily II)